MSNSLQVSRPELFILTQERVVLRCTKVTGIYDTMKTDIFDQKSSTILKIEPFVCTQHLIAAADLNM